MASGSLAGLSSTAIDQLFSATFANSQAGLDSLAASALGQGIDLFQQKDYSRAVDAFRRSAALSPFSDNTAKAYDYLGRALLKLEKRDEAIKVYREAIRIYPARDEFHLALGDIYLKEQRGEEALKAFETAVRLNPRSAEGRYSLGQSYIDAGQLDDARRQFERVVQLTPLSAAGYYGLGQTARLAGDHATAVAQLEKAIRADRKFEKAYVELGFTYADLGDFYNAGQQEARLIAIGSPEAETVSRYAAGAQAPRFLAVTSPDFNAALPRATAVSALNDALAAAGRSHLFSMNFTFSKEMSEASVMNPANWLISRATLQESGGLYNAGLTPPRTEVAIPPLPLQVSYNSDTNTATVRFRISQNADANATIDPARIVFRFYGEDSFGKAMDRTGDQYSGFSGVA